MTLIPSQLIQWSLFSWDSCLQSARWLWVSKTQAHWVLGCCLVTQCYPLPLDSSWVDGSSCNMLVSLNHSQSFHNSYAELQLSCCLNCTSLKWQVNRTCFKIAIRLILKSSDISTMLHMSVRILCRSRLALSYLRNCEKCKSLTSSETNTNYHVEFTQALEMK